MSTCNKEQPQLDSRMHGHGAAIILACSALISGMIACSSRNSQPLPSFIFDERPFQMNCADRPSPPPPGTHSFVTISPQAPYARTRLDTLNLPLYEIPALTIAAEPTNWIHIAGASQDHWSLRFCARGEGNTAEEAQGYLQKISMQRTGSLLTLNSTDARGPTGGLTGGQGTLLLDAPAEAPVTVHSDAAVEVHDMTGPIRISARGRATILNTSGLVDASAMIVDFAGSQGNVSLNAPWDINIKLTAQQFRGNLSANAQRQVHVLFPPGFQTPVDVLVNRPGDFVCHADFCSKIKSSHKNSLYRFTYGDVESAPDHISLRSESEQVVLDTTQ
jgi:hypothetical protein